MDAAILLFNFFCDFLSRLIAQWPTTIVVIIVIAIISAASTVIGGPMPHGRYR
jgi:hypothetical protein